jgi:hypothetical protein
MKTIEQIINTFLIAMDTLWEKDALIIGSIFVVFLIEIISIFIKRSVKKRIFAIQKDLSTEIENPEYYLEYYKK